MIDQVLNFLCRQVNNYLHVKLDPPPSGEAVALYNVSHLGDGANQPNGNNSTPSNVFLTLVNIEENRVTKSHDTVVRNGTSLSYKNPEIYLNLYLIFSSNLPYTEALKRLSLVIQFFQHQNVFTPVLYPELADSNVEKLLVELHSMSFEQLNHLWSILGGKYLPSVMYKVRQITIDEKAINAGGGLIKEIQLGGKTKLPLS